MNQEYQGRCLFNDTRVSTLAEPHDEVVGKFDHSVSLLKEQQDRGRRRYGESRLQPSPLWSLTGEMEAWKRLGEGHSAEAQRDIMATIFVRSCAIPTPMAPLLEPAANVASIAA